MLVKNALTSSKTPAIILNEIKMMSSTFNGVHFLVEGDDDSRFWKPRIAKQKTSIVNCEGRPNLLGASQLILRQGIGCAAGVYDSDFDQHFGIIHCPDILAATDENDLEVTLLASEALSAILHEYADESLIRTFEVDRGMSAVSYLERVSQEFGKLRLLNKQLNHNVDFDRLSPYRFVSPEDWSLDLVGLHAEYTRLAGISAAQLQSDMAAKIPTTKSWGLCQGHDSVRILAQGLRKRIGKKQISEQDLAKILRIAYSVEQFQRSQMYQTLRTLEAKLPVAIFT